VSTVSGQLQGCCGESPEELSRELNRRSGPGSHAAPPARGRGLPHTRCAALDPLRPPPDRWTARPAGPVPPIGDAERLRLVLRVLAGSPFAGGGYRKVRARLRRQHGVRVTGRRVLRLLRREGLLATQPARAGAGEIKPADQRPATIVGGPRPGCRGLLTTGVDHAGQHLSGCAARPPSSTCPGLLPSPPAPARPAGTAARWRRPSRQPHTKEAYQAAQRTATA
jgi:HTH-like domain